MTFLTWSQTFKTDRLKLRDASFFLRFCAKSHFKPLLDYWKVLFLFTPSISSFTEFNSQRSVPTLTCILCELEDLRIFSQRDLCRQWYMIISGWPVSIRFFWAFWIFFSFEVFRSLQFFFVLIIVVFWFVELIHMCFLLQVSPLHILSLFSGPSVPPQTRVYAARDAGDPAALGDCPRRRSCPSWRVRRPRCCLAIPQPIFMVRMWVFSRSQWDRWSQLVRSAPVAS